MSQIVAAIIGNAVLIGALLAILKFWFEGYMKQSAVRFEKDLDARNDAQVERLRAELRLLEQREGSFHARRFQALSEVYAAITTADDAFGRWTRIFRAGGAPTVEEEGQMAVDAYDRLLVSLNDNRLWLGRELAATADELLQALHEVWAEFIDKDTRTAATWKMVRDVMQSRVPTIRKAFENQAESLLRGVIPEAPDLSARGTSNRLG